MNFWTRRSRSSMREASKRQRMGTNRLTKMCFCTGGGAHLERQTVSNVDFLLPPKQNLYLGNLIVFGRRQVEPWRCPFCSLIYFTDFEHGLSKATWSRGDCRHSLRDQSSWRRRAPTSRRFSTARDQRYGEWSHRLRWFEYVLYFKDVQGP